MIGTTEMANLSYLDKLQLEKLLGMPSGYVLNFSDKTFQEFVLDSVGIDIYSPGMDAGETSKAKRLRHLWKVGPNHVVGRLLLAFCDYYRAVERQPDQTLLSECRGIAQRLASGNGAPPPQPFVQAHQSPAVPDTPAATSFTSAASIAAQSDALLKTFDEMACSSEPIRRGYLLEDMLVRTFQLHQIDVVRSFKRNNGSEQIDAAFKLEGWHYLVECRWREKLADTRQVDGLRG